MITIFSFGYHQEDGVKNNFNFSYSPFLIKNYFFSFNSLEFFCCHLRNKNSINLSDSAGTSTYEKIQTITYNCSNSINAPILKLKTHSESTVNVIYWYI